MVFKSFPSPRTAQIWIREASDIFEIFAILHISVQGSKYKFSVKKIHLISVPISFYEEASACNNFRIWMKEASACTYFLYLDFFALTSLSRFWDALTSFT